MNKLEEKISKYISDCKPGVIGKALNSVKKTINRSAEVVKSIDNIGDNLGENISDQIGGITGSIIGEWVVGKTVKTVTNISTGIVAGTIKTVGGIIPGSDEFSLPEHDVQIAHIIETHELPLEQTELFSLLQYSFNSHSSSNSPYGKATKEAFRNLNIKVYEVISKTGDPEKINLAKQFQLKKRFRLI